MPLPKHFSQFREIVQTMFPNSITSHETASLVKVSRFDLITCEVIGPNRHNGRLLSTESGAIVLSVLHSSS